MITIAHWRHRGRCSKNGGNDLIQLYENHLHTLSNTKTRHNNDPMILLSFSPFSEVFVETFLLDIFESHIFTDVDSIVEL